MIYSSDQLFFFFFYINLKASKHISFGTTADRPTYPDQVPFDRFGNENTPHRGVRSVGPGQYENHSTTAFTNEKKPLSLRGYVLGARTAQRQFYSSEIRAPSPTHYQHESANKNQHRPSFKPFNQSSNRFKSSTEKTLPGLDLSLSLSNLSIIEPKK